MLCYVNGHVLGLPDVLFLYCSETNSMVEEFMLLANVSVATHICEHFPQVAVLRRHPSPATSNYEPLVKAALSKVSMTCVLLNRTGFFVWVFHI